MHTIVIQQAYIFHKCMIEIILNLEVVVCYCLTSTVGSAKMTERHNCKFDRTGDPHFNLYLRAAFKFLTKVIHNPLD